MGGFLYIIIEINSDNEIISTRQMHKMASLYFACSMEKQHQKSRAENEAILTSGLGTRLRQSTSIELLPTVAWQNMNIIMPSTCICLC